MKTISALIFILLMAVPVYSANWTVYDMDFDVEASTVEAAPEGCVKRGEGGSVKTMANDCEIPMLDVESIYISWNSVDDVLGTHASTDWSINIRCIAMQGDSYPATGTDPTETGYWEEDVNVDGEYGGFNLTVPKGYACKTRVDADDANVAAPTVKWRLTFK